MPRLHNDSGMIYTIIGVILFILAVTYCQVQTSRECERKGGVYLSREAKCVAGLREIK